MGRSVPPTKGWRVKQELYWKSSRQSTTRSWGKIFIHAEEATRGGCKIIVSETANHNVQCTNELFLLQSGDETDQFFQSDKNNTGPQGRKMPHG